MALEITQSPSKPDMPLETSFEIQGLQGQRDILGTISVGIRDNQFVLHNIYVPQDPNLRRKGVGNELLRKAVTWGLEHGVTKLSGRFRPSTDSDRDEVKCWYQKCGITVTESNELVGDLNQINELITHPEKIDK